MAPSKILTVMVSAVLLGSLSVSASMPVVWETNLAGATQLSDLLGSGNGQFNSSGTKGSGSPTLTFDNVNDVIQLRTYNYTDGALGYPYVGLSQQNFGIGDAYLAHYELTITAMHTNGAVGKRGQIEVGSVPVWDGNSTTFGRFNLNFNADGLVIQNQGNMTEQTSAMAYNVPHRVEFLCVNGQIAARTFTLSGGESVVVQPGTMKIYVDGQYQGTFTAISGEDKAFFRGFQIYIGGHQSSSAYSMRGIDIHSLKIYANQPERPLKILFIGNSFTNNTPMVAEFRTLVTNAGFATPSTATRAVGGATLESHIANPDTMTRVDEGGWDYVVLQEYSTRPTISSANYANPAQFEHDVAWLYDRIKASSPNAMIVLYETWARHEDNVFYPGVFPNRDDMQNQLTYWYHHAAESYVPANVSWPVKTDIFLAPAGEVWHANYHGMNYRLHAEDLYHQNLVGSRVNAMTILGAIYQCRVSDLPGPVDRQERYLRTLIDQTNSLYHDIGANNYGPDVDAGADLLVGAPQLANLVGTITDDGQPSGQITSLWSQVSGPGSVTFANASSASTTAAFSTPGTYVLRLKANDGELETYDELTVTYAAVPYLQFARTDLGDGLSGWRFYITNGDGLLASYTVALGFEGDGAATLQQMQAFGTLTVNDETNATAFHGLGNPPYDKNRDCWTYLPFSTNPILGTNPLTGGSLTGVVEGANSYALSLYSGSGSQLDNGVNVAYIVADGNVRWTGTIRRNNINYAVSGVTDLVIEQPTIPGDYNNDGIVDLADYTIWADHYGQTGPNVPGDGNGDGVVDLADYTVWADHYGQTLGG